MPQSKSPAKFRRTVVATAAALAIGSSMFAASMPANASESAAAPSEPTESYAWLVPAPQAGLRAGSVTKPGDHDRIQAMQQRLAWAGLPWLWASGNLDAGTRLAVKMFQAKHMIKPTGRATAQTVQKLREVAGNGSLDKRCMSGGIVLCVSKTQKVTRYVKDGKVLKTLNTNFGPEKGDPKFGFYSATREGSFRIFSKELNPISVLYHVNMPFFMGFDGGIGFHYSGHFAKTGYFDTSQGCTVIDDFVGMKWLYEHTPMNSKVVVYQ